MVGAVELLLPPKASVAATLLCVARVPDPVVVGVGAAASGQR